MRSKDLQGFGPVGTNGPTDTPAEVAELLPKWRAQLIDPEWARMREAATAEHLCAMAVNPRVIVALVDAATEGIAAKAQLAKAWSELACSDDISAITLAAGINQLQRAREAAESQLAAQRERDGRDAARYRWLRDDPPVELAVRQRTEYGPRLGFSYLYLDGEQLDAAIDAALKDRSP
jgi:hypothetical protein